MTFVQRNCKPNATGPRTRQRQSFCRQSGATTGPTVSWRKRWSLGVLNLRGLGEGASVGWTRHSRLSSGQPTNSLTWPLAGSLRVLMAPVCLVWGEELQADPM